MASVASQLKEEVTGHVQSDSRGCARDMRRRYYFPNNLRLCYSAAVGDCTKAGDD